MTPPHIPEAILNAPVSKPRELAWATNPTERVVRFIYRGELDLARTFVDVPWWVIKDAAGNISGLESAMERQGIAFPKVAQGVGPQRVGG